MLRPGGVIAFCGEPSRYGDRVAAVPKRGARVSPLWRALMRASAPLRRNGGRLSREERLEQMVDVHAFTPAASTQAARAGLESVRVSGEELAASCSAGRTDARGQR